MCETSKIASVAICVRSSYKMPGLYGMYVIYRRVFAPKSCLFSKLIFL